MLDIRLRYQGKGLFRVASKSDYEQAEQEYEPNEMVRAQTTKARSLRQNNLLHAVCEAAYDNHRGGPTPEEVPTWRHMKSWLLIEANHCDVVAFKPGAFSKEAVRELRCRHDTTHFTLKGNGQILMKTARQTRGLSKDDMGELLDRILAIVHAEVVPGVDLEQLLNMAKQKAA